MSSLAILPPLSQTTLNLKQRTEMLNFYQPSAILEV